MKDLTKIGLVIALVLGLSSILSAGVLNVPKDYKFVKSVHYGAISIYKKGNIYVSVVNLDKASINVGSVNKSSSNRFVKQRLYSWWSQKNYNTLGMFNGQFFNFSGDIFSSTTTLSFPLRSYWHNINTHKDYGSLRTLVVDNYGKVKIFSNYQTTYLNYSKELIVGLNPYTNKSSSSRIGRSYIGGIPKYYSTNSYNREMKYLIFFISISDTQSTMMNEITRKWKIQYRDIIMMDGSGSAQMRVDNLKVYGKDGHGELTRYRSLPNVITIEKKGLIGLLM